MGINNRWLWVLNIQKLKEKIGIRIIIIQERPWPVSMECGAGLH